MNPITRISGLVFLLSLPALAQSDLGFKGTFDGIPKAPTPVDQFGNPIPLPTRTPAEIEAERIAQQQRTEQIRAEDERPALERQRQAEERREADRLGEAQQSRNRNTTAIYVVLAVVATLVVSRLFK